jgi:hypothetical protein
MGKKFINQKKACAIDAQSVILHVFLKSAMKKTIFNFGLTLFLIIAVHAAFALVGGQISLNAQDSGSCDPPQDPTTGPGSD